MQIRYDCLFDCLQRTAVQRSNKTLILMLLGNPLGHTQPFQLKIFSGYMSL